MALTISQINTLGTIDKVIFNSIDVSLYQLSIELNGQEFFITDNQGNYVRAFNFLELQKLFRGLPYNKMVIRHNSPYDEMIGLTEDLPPGRNTLEVEVKDNGLSD